MDTTKAREVGDKIGIDWDKTSIEEFAIGLLVELEHGTRTPKTNITDDDPVLTGKIAYAHLLEISDYYSRLKKMETDAKVNKQITETFQKLSEQYDFTTRRFNDVK